MFHVLRKSLTSILNKLKLKTKEVLKTCFSFIFMQKSKTLMTRYKKHLLREAFITFVHIHRSS
jgi:hypothetical protein